MLTRLSTNRNKVLISCRSMTTINSILIDLSGTLHVGEQPTPNAVSALKRYVSFGLITFNVMFELQFQVKGN